MKRPIEAPNFDKQKGPRFALEKEKDGPQKDLSYVDPGN